MTRPVSWAPLIAIIVAGVLLLAALITVLAVYAL